LLVCVYICALSYSDEGNTALEAAISSGGGNLSICRLQILALVRAIVRRNKPLTSWKVNPQLLRFGALCPPDFFITASAIDYEADTVIRNSLHTNLGSDMTQFTTAHRLQTVTDADKIASHIDIVLPPVSC
jgi:ABC-type multidrug transport system fused ATPase/permease subunit